MLSQPTPWKQRWSPGCACMAASLAGRAQPLTFQEEQIPGSEGNDRHFTGSGTRRAGTPAALLPDAGTPLREAPGWPGMLLEGGREGGSRWGMWRGLCSALTT